MLPAIAQRKLGEAVNTINNLAQDRRPFVIQCIYCNTACASVAPEQTFAFIALAYDMSLNVCVCMDCLKRRM